MIEISYADYYLPEQKKSTKQYLMENGIPIDSDDFISSSGIKYIYTTQSKDYIGMLKKLLDKYFGKDKCNPKDFTHIIFTNLSNYIQDKVNIPYLIQKDYGLENASIIYLNNACASCIQAIQIGSGLLKERNKKVLILSITSNLIERDRFMDITITGDAAGIMVLSNENDAKIQIVDSLSMANGSYSYNLYYDKESGIDKLKLLFGNIIAIKKLLLNNKMKIDDISIFIPQSINIEIYKTYAKYLNIPYEKIFMANICKGGHLENVDTIRNYISCSESIKSGDYFIIMGVGLLGLDAMYNTVLCKKNSYT